MTTVEGLFQKYSTLASCQQLCVGLAPLLERCGEGREAPSPVKCTKRLYTLFTKHLDNALSKCKYEYVCVLLNVLRYIAKGSLSPQNGYAKLSSFGLPNKIQSWLSVLCLQSVAYEGSEEWSKAVDETLFTLTIILNFSDDVKESMVPILPSLLQCISNSSLPCSTLVEAARGANILLEMCGVDYKCKLNANPKIKKLIQSMGVLVQKAGDFECQVTMVECLFRLTTERDRTAMAKQWYMSSPLVLRTFNAIRESNFEVDSRKFLNILNSNAGGERSVYSLPCNSAFLGTLELHRPNDEGMYQFWVDFNTSSKSISMFVEDPTMTSDSDPDEGMWEVVNIKNSFVQEWSVQQKGRELILLIQLNKPAHTLLSAVAFSPSNTITIGFGVNNDPTHPTELVFTSEKKQCTTNVATNAHRNTNKKFPTKSASEQSYLDHPKELQEISPIELPPNTPAVGGHLNSQGSFDTPLNRPIPPITTPATSTPKHRPFGSSTRNSITRPPLKFVSSGLKRQPPAQKASCAIANVHLMGGKSKIISTPGIHRTATSNRECSSYQDNAKKNGVPPERQSIASRKQAEKSGQLQIQKKNESTAQKEPMIKASNLPATSCKRVPQTVSKERRVYSDPLAKLKNATKKNEVEKILNSKCTPSFQHLDDSSEVDSPVLDYDPPNRTTHQKELHNKSASHLESAQLKSLNSTTVNKLDRGFVNTNTMSLTSSPEIEINTNGKKSPSHIAATTKRNRTTGVKSRNQSYTSSRPALLDISNNASLNRRGQRREFNLSAGPQKKGKRGRNSRGKNQTHSNNSSFNNSCDLDAIPDSMPLTPSQEVQVCELENENKASSKSHTLRRSSKRIQVPVDNDSFDFDSDPESDKSWELTQKRKKGGWKTGANKVTGATNKKTKPNGGIITAKTLLSSSRTQKTTKNSSRPALSETTCTITPASRQASTKGSTARDSKQTSTVTARKKRSVDDVYDSEPTPKPESSRSKVTQKSSSKLSLSKKDTAKATSTTRSNPPCKPTKQPAAKTRPPIQDIGSKNQLTVTPIVKSVTRQRVTGTSKSIWDTSPLYTLDPLVESSPFKPPPKKSIPSKRTASSTKKRPLSVNLDLEVDGLDLSSPSPKKQRLEKGRRSSGYYSADVLHSSTSSSVDDSLVDDNQDDVYSSLSSLDQDKNNNTPLHITPAPAAIDPVSPSSSLHSSQVEADSNVTIGFQQICRNLIAQSGKKNKGSRQQVNILTAKKSNNVKEKRQKQTTATEKRPSSPITLTQLSKQIIRDSEKKCGTRKGSATTLTKKKQPQQKKNLLAHISRDTPRCSKYTPIGDLVEQESSDDLESHSSKEPASTHSRRRSSITDDINSVSNADSISTILEDCTPPVMNYSLLRLPGLGGTDMDSEPFQINRIKRASLDKFASKATPAEMSKLWSGQQKEREQALLLYKERLSREITRLEKEVKTTQNAEEQAFLHLKQQHKFLTTSIKQQHSQVERLRSLQVSFHEQFGSLEQGQAKQQVTAQRSLKKEMQNLQKRLLAESQRKEVTRIKQALQVMLLQV